MMKKNKMKNQSFLEKILYLDGFTAGLIVCGFAAIILLIIKHYVI